MLVVVKNRWPADFSEADSQIRPRQAHIFALRLVSTKLQRRPRALLAIASIIIHYRVF